MSAINAGVKNAISFLKSLVASVPQTSRSLRRSPGFVAIATLSLGAALGMSTSVFALIDGMTHPVTPYAHDEQLFEVRVFGTAKVMPSTKDVSDALVGIPGIARITTAGLNWLDVELAESLVKLQVSYIGPDFFELLGAHARLGRLPSLDDSRLQNVAVLSDDVWRKRFSNRKEIGDARITIGSHVYSVIGVMPPHTNAPSWVDLWIPAAADATRGIPYVRLHPGVTPKDVQPHLDAMMRRMTAAYASPMDRPFAATLITLHLNPLTLNDFHHAMYGAALCVLLIACANVAALMLARGNVRKRDYALRLALGASRGDIASEVMFEVGTLAVIGAAAGAIAATWVSGLVTSTMPVAMVALGFAEPHWSARVLMMSAAAVVLAFGVAGGIPAWQASRTDPAGTLKDSSGGNTGRSHTRFRWLVVGELALTMTLLVSASLMLKSVRIMAAYKFGVDTKAMLSARVDLVNTGNKTPIEEIARAYRAPLDRIRSVPGVESAAMTAPCDIDHHVVTTDRTIAGGAPATMPQCTNVTSGFFQTLGYSVAEGRDFSDGDMLNGGAVILDQKTAKKLFPHERAIGRTLKLGDFASRKPWMTIVGVVRDKDVQFHLYPERGADSTAVMFISAPDSSRLFHYYPIRVSPGVPTVRVDVSRAIVSALPPRSYSQVEPWSAGYEEELSQERFVSLIFTLLGAASLVLGAAGLFSVISYIAGQRMREFAVRVALGATRENLAGLVLREALVMSLGGTAVGAGFGMWAGFLIWDKMYGVYPVDAGALIAAEVTLLLATMLACLVPALSAMRADPVSVMRAT